MVKDEKLDIWGCCENYNDRVNVTADIAGSNTTCKEAIHKYVILTKQYFAIRYIDNSHNITVSNVTRTFLFLGTEINSYL